MLVLSVPELFNDGVGTEEQRRRRAAMPGELREHAASWSVVGAEFVAENLERKQGGCQVSVPCAGSFFSAGATVGVAGLAVAQVWAANVAEAGSAWQCVLAAWAGWRWLWTGLGICSLPRLQIVKPGSHHRGLR